MSLNGCSVSKRSIVLNAQTLTGFTVPSATAFLHRAHEDSPMHFTREERNAKRDEEHRVERPEELRDEEDRPSKQDDGMGVLSSFDERKTRQRDFFLTRTRFLKHTASIKKIIESALK